MEEVTKQEIANDEIDPNKRSYLRKGREKNFMEEEFESFFTKKKDLMYGNQSLLQDEFKIKPTLKYWLLSNYLKFKNDEDSILSDEFNRLFTKVVDNYKKNKQYEKLYLNLVSFCMQNSILMDSGFYEENTRISVDYSLTIKNRKYFIIFIPQNDTCFDYSDKVYEIDGLFKLVTNALKKNNPEIKIIHFFEHVLTNYNDEELKLKFYQLINVLA